MSAVAMVAAFSVAMEQHDIPPDTREQIIDAALKIVIERTAPNTLHDTQVHS